MNVRSERMKWGRRSKPGGEPQTNKKHGWSIGAPETVVSCQRQIERQGERTREWMKEIEIKRGREP